MPKRITLLILSVGSLLGENILDALETIEHPLRIIGINSREDSPQNFRCDSFYLFPETLNPNFQSQLIKLLHQETPDIILAGRDLDVWFLTHFKMQFPQFQNSIPYGSHQAATIMMDKGLSYQFAETEQLNYVPTLILQQETSHQQIEDFAAKLGFPLIYKPQQGHGSRGVSVLLNKHQLKCLDLKQQAVLQPYLQAPPDLIQAAQQFQNALPLFFQLPEEQQFACQTVISATGQIGDWCCVNVHLKLGRVEYIQRRHEPELIELAQKCAEAFREIGWQGSFNVQAKRNAQQQWQVFEFSPRMTGSLSARRLLGYDEIGALFQAFYPELHFPGQAFLPQATGFVKRSLKDNFIAFKDLNLLKSKQRWPE